MRFFIQFTPSALPIKVAAMATEMSNAPGDAVFNQLCRPGLDGVVYKHVILYGVRSRLTLTCGGTCHSHLGEPANEHEEKYTDEIHFCEIHKINDVKGMFL